MWWLLACAEPPPEPAEACTLGSIAVGGDLVPGKIVTLSAGGEATWEVSAGTLSSETGSTVQWTLPVDIATNEPETLQVHAAGCDATASTTVEVDWPLAERTVVLFNPSVDGSADVASYYADFRGIPDTALCAVDAPDSTTLDGTTYEAFQAAVQTCVDAVGTRVHYIVPVYGVPYKVSGRIADINPESPVATVSLDAMLALGTESVGLDSVVYSDTYQDGDSTTYTYDPYKPFGKIRNRAGDSLYLVARIDGADADASMALVDRTAEAESLAGALEGTVYVDGRFGDAEPAADAGFGSYEWGEWNMWGTRAVFEDLGAWPVVWDGNEAEFGTDPAPLTCPDALYYAGWYSYYNYNDAFTWAPGAIGGHLDSCSACDLRDGTWAAEALQRGITATFGAVNEPYVSGMPEYDQLFYYLTQGATYGEAAYESTVLGAWMMVFVGDPLYRPFPAVEE